MLMEWERGACWLEEDLIVEKMHERGHVFGVEGEGRRSGAKECGQTLQIRQRKRNLPESLQKEIQPCNILILVQ